MNQWLELMKEDSNKEYIIVPAVLPEGFAFSKGEIEGPTGGFTYEIELKYYKMLKERAIAENENITWQKAVPEDQCHIFKNALRSIYSNHSQEQIEFSFGLVHGDRQMIILSNPEKIQIGNMEAYYSEIDSNETSILKTISGYELKNGKTYAIQISTQSNHVTKDDLFLIANHLKWIRN
jgi:hypothetical protein